jgi:hypothetical protein
MNLNILTLVLDGAPWIGAQFAELSRIKDIEWHWSIVEGSAQPVKDTAWMGGQGAKVSHDGTHQFLMALADHPRITINSKGEWDGKTEMLNAGLTAFKNDGVLLQVDCDEIWSAWQYKELLDLFQDEAVNTVMVAMDYMLGPNVISTSKNGYGNRHDEWVRAWRYAKGLWMECHEPPRFNGNRGRVIQPAESVLTVGRILHMAWVHPWQVAQKQRIYGKNYQNAVEDWEKLQQNKAWPVDDLAKFLPWVGKGGSADRVF